MKIEKNKRLTWYSRQHDAMSQALTPPLLLLSKEGKNQGLETHLHLEPCSLWR